MKSQRRTATVPAFAAFPAMRGFAIASAVFLLVVLAGLGVAMVRFSTMQHAGAALDEQGERAYQAAVAGVEWGLYASLAGGAAACPSSPTSFVPPAPTLGGFTVTVTCSAVTSTSATPAITVRRLTATACSIPSAGACPGAAGNADYVQRVVQVTF